MIPDDTANSSNRPRIVILGGGYGGAYCAQALKRRLRGVDAEVLLIDRNNYFVFFPLLVEAGTGSLEPRHAVVPVRDFVRGGEFRMAEVRDVDVARQRVAYRLIGDDEDRTVAYDHLVLSLGSVTRLPPVPGLREHGFQMKSLGDAVALRDRAIQLLELANASDATRRDPGLLHFVVVGGNFTGAEVAGEFEMFLKNASRRYPHVRREDCRFTLIELSDRILRSLGGDLSDFAMRHLSRRKIDIMLETSIREVHADHVVLDSGHRLDTRTVIWCAGIEPNPLIAGLGLPCDEHGYILCERDLRVKGFENLWAIGDGAVNTDAKGQAYPATAQHATRQGAHAARNIASVLKGRSTTPCELANRGTLAALGCRTGVAKVFGFRISGFAAWWLWRTVYLLKMPRLSRKVRVALDWTIDMVFSRDYVQLGVHRSDSMSRLTSPDPNREEVGMRVEAQAHKAPPRDSP